MPRRKGSHATTHQNVILGCGILRRIFDDNTNRPKEQRRAPTPYQITDFHAALITS
jgi:hypothetical protein